MKIITPIDRMFFLLAAIIAAYQVVIGIEGLGEIPILGFSFTFGMILVVASLLIIVGYSARENPWVVVLSTVIPLGVSGGMVAKYFPDFLHWYAIWIIVGLAGVVFTQSGKKGKVAILWLAFIHATAGLVIVLAPIYLVSNGLVGNNLLFASLGGALISGMGLMMFVLNEAEHMPALHTRQPRIFAIAYFLLSLSLATGFWQA
jgi:hypothetical protein